MIEPRKTTFSNFKGNIYTDGTYFKNNPTCGIEDSEWKAKKIHSLILKNRLEIKSITEVGCGAGGILSELSQKMPVVDRFSGYDISADAIRLAMNYSGDRIEFLNEDFISIATEKIDLLLMIDVIEHTENYYDFLKRLLPKARYFIFHIPLDLSCRTLLKPHILLQQRKAVGHIHYYSKEMVFWMLKDTGYSIIDWQYTKPVGDVNRSVNFKQWVKKTLRNISFSLNEHLSDKLWGGYSMLIVAQKTDE